jgi:hypothetical protein
VDTTEDIFVIGDVHGDVDRLRGVLFAAKLIQSRDANLGGWLGGKAVLVVTGDMIDKGTTSLDVIRVLTDLQVGARGNGGRVIITMGNHEAEFLAFPTGDKTSEFVSELKKAGKDVDGISKCGHPLGHFLCNLPIAARVNDWFFSHAGYTNGRSISVIANAIQAGVTNAGYSTPELVGDYSILEARLNNDGPGGLPWFRGGTKKTDDAGVKTLLTNYAKALGVNHIVQGHQPEKVEFPDGTKRKRDAIFQRYGLLFLVDTGMSLGVDGADSVGGALRITRQGTKQTAFAICANGTAPTTLWDSDTNQDVGAQLCPLPK